MAVLCGAHSPDTALSGCWLDSWGPRDWNSPGGRPDDGRAKCWRCAGDRNREYSRQCRCDSSHCCCDVPDAATRTDCPLDGPILFSASTSLRAKEKQCLGDSRFVEGNLATICGREVPSPWRSSADASSLSSVSPKDRSMVDCSRCCQYLKA